MRRRASSAWSVAVVAAVLALLAACSGSRAPDEVGVYKLGEPYQEGGRWYHPSFDSDYDRIGLASWYGPGFHGRRTANGETFDSERLSAAHPTLPLPSIVRVTNLENRRSMLVRVNDRGPFVGDRVIDLSRAAARRLGFERKGVASVRVQFVSLADAKGEAPQPDQMADAAAARCPEGGYIQVGAFAEPARAERLARELSVFVPVPVSARPPGPDRYARVRLGPLADARDVDATLEHLRSIGFRSAFAVTDDGRAWREC